MQPFPSHKYLREHREQFSKMWIARIANIGNNFSKSEFETIESHDYEITTKQIYSI
jgi:hypothetical protein